MTDFIPESFIPFVEQLANASGHIIRQYYKRDISYEVKEDMSPVTEADKEVERALRALILASYPEHGVIGEEFEPSNPKAEYQWYIDPIDGTKSFMIGRPIFGTLIALVKGDMPWIGVIDQPILGERWSGVRGFATDFNSRPVETRGCPSLASAVLCTTSPNLFIGEDYVKFEKIRQKAHYTVYGGDCYSYGLLASGRVDIVVETGLKTHDFLALKPIIEGAKGIMTDWNGNPITTHSDGRVIACGDKRTHKEALKMLRG